MLSDSERKSNLMLSHSLVPYCNFLDECFAPFIFEIVNDQVGKEIKRDIPWLVISIII